MWPVEVEKRWRELMDEAIGGMDEWRRQHRRATFKEIETALDERLLKVRAQMLEDAALLSPLTDLTQTTTEERPRCPNPACQQVLEAHGVETRSLRTDGDQTITLTRSYAQCPSCGTGLFPPGSGTGVVAG
jgi:hypothetical protein